MFIFSLTNNNVDQNGIHVSNESRTLKNDEVTSHETDSEQNKTESVNFSNNHET